MPKKEIVSYDGGERRVVGEADVDEEGNVTNASVTDPEFVKEMYPNLRVSVEGLKPSTLKVVDSTECVVAGRHGLPGFMSQQGDENESEFMRRVGKKQRRCEHCGRFVFEKLWPDNPPEET